MKEKNKKEQKKLITRKDALKKAGKIAALTATSMLILNPPKSAAAASPDPSGSPRPPRDW